MNRTERKILGPLIKAVRRSHPYEWETLKYQVFDYGYQSHYPMQDEFLVPARHVLRKLKADVKSALLTEWSARNPVAQVSEEAILDDYAYEIVAEIVRRAGIAADRTNE